MIYVIYENQEFSKGTFEVYSSRDVLINRLNRFNTDGRRWKYLCHYVVKSFPPNIQPISTWA